jgi:hypothetical protein
MLAGWVRHTNWDLFGEDLTARGFLAEDIPKLKDYVSAHDFEREFRREALPLAISFSKIVKKYDKIKRPVDDAAVLSYIYQREKMRAEMNREWAEALFQSINAQSARILLAYFDEMKSTGVWAPSDQRVGIDGRVAAQVVRLALLTNEAGMDGVVASPHEVRAIRDCCGRRFIIVTPGIRPAESSRNDQQRIMTPAAAVKASVDYIVVGRPILEAKDPVAAARSIVTEMKSSSKEGPLLPAFRVFISSLISTP